MRNKLIYVTFGLLGLSACGGSGTGDSEIIRGGPVDPTQITLGAVPAMTEAEFDGIDEEITVDIGAQDFTLLRDSSNDLPRFESYGNIVNSAHLGETFLGGGRVILVTDPRLPNGAAAAFFERLETTDVPDAGATDFIGDYVGYLTDVDTGTLVATVAGDVTVNVNFATAMIDGLIDNRERVLSLDRFELTNVDLAVTSIVNGSFTGTTSGGAIDEAGATASAGDYGGLITGATGQEAIGGLQIMHDRNGDDLLETGVFLADD